MSVTQPKATLQHRQYTAICLLAACVFVWNPVTATSSWPLAYFLVCILFIVAVFPLVCTYADGRFDFFEPITGICVLYFIYFGVASIYNLNTLSKVRLTINIEDGLEVALVYAVLALVSLQAGYRLVGKWVRSVVVHEPIQGEGWNRIFRVSAGVYAIGLGARVYGVSQGFHIRFAASDIYGQFSGIHILYDYLGFFSTFGFILMAAYSFMAPRPRGGRVLVWGVMLPIELFFAFLGGPKEYFVPILIAPLICYHYGRRAVPVYKFLIPLSVMALIVFPVMTSYRSLDPRYLRSAALMDAVPYAISGVWEVVSEKGLLEYLRWSLELVVERLDGIYTFTGVLLNVPSPMEYQWGKTIIVGFALLVPTVIWEGKYDYYVATITWGERIFGVPVGGGGISITQPGEMFLNFGIFGMLLGMFLLGGAYRLIHHWLVGSRYFFGIVIYAILWMTLVNPEYPLAAYYSNAVKQAALLFLISKIGGARWRRKRIGP